MQRTNLIAMVALGLLLSACGSDEAPSVAASPAPSEDGRSETRSIRATDSIGYAGDAIADQVDGALDANDARKQSLDAAIDGSSGSN